MSVLVHRGRLLQEMTRRGWAATDLARESRLSQATISAALAGRPVAAKSFAHMAKALSRTPVLDIADALIMSDPRNAGLG
jgi:transcriptional regulator with XRE-family HTH domain